MLHSQIKHNYNWNPSIQILLCELWFQGVLPSFALSKNKNQSNQFISDGEFGCYLLHQCIILSTGFIKL